MIAYNVVRFRVKPGHDSEFVAMQRAAVEKKLPGLIEAALVKTGDRCYCLVGKWKSFDEIVAARPEMIKSLDGVRDLLEDLGSGLGVTDPVSGEAVLVS